MEAKKTLKILHIACWALCIGIAMKAGGILISFGVSLKNPEAVKNLYKGLNLQNIYQLSIKHYSLFVIGKITFLVTQAYIAYLMARFLKHFNIAKPFNSKLLVPLNSINLSILLLWFLTILHNIQLVYLEKLHKILYPLVSSDFILLSGVVLILSTLFKKGIEIQQENELTI